MWVCNKTCVFFYMKTQFCTLPPVRTNLLQGGDQCVIGQNIVGVFVYEIWLQRADL